MAVRWPPVGFGSLLRVVLLLSMLAASWPVLAAPAAPRSGGAACVMAKWQGNTLDFALAIGAADPATAQSVAEQELRDKGYHRYPPHNVSILHHQAVTNLASAFVVVIRSDHHDARGRPRTSFGCGFSGRSFEDALWAAIRDLQSHSWGWKPDLHGYRVVRQLRY